MNETFGDVIRAHAARKGDVIAVSYADSEISWADLSRRSTARAVQLKDLGVRRDDLVAIALPNGVVHHEITLAVWKAGATPCIVPPRLPDQELAQIIAVARPRLVVRSAGDALAGVDQLDPSRPAPETTEEAWEKPARHWKAVASGGSTGRPKLIVDHAEARMSPTLSGLIDMIGIPRDGVMLNPGPLHHNAPFLFSNAAVLAGCRVVGMERFDAETCLALIERHRVSWVCLVPTMMHRIWSLPPDVRERYDLSSLKAVWHMASACPPWLKRAWIDWLGPDRIFETYAGTEGAATVIGGRDWLKKPGSVGRVAPGTLTLLDEAGRPCPPGVVGEIYFPAEASARFHYVGQTLKAADDGRFSLGDLGHVDDEGYLFLADRRTDLIIRGGANIYPAEVEAAIEEHEGVAGAVVVGLPCDEYGQRVHAVVQTHADRAPSAEALSQFLGDRLTGYKRPESFDFVSGALRDDAGKVRRSALRSEREAWLAEGRSFQIVITRPTRTPRNTSLGLAPSGDLA